MKIKGIPQEPTISEQVMSEVAKFNETPEEKEWWRKRMDRWVTVFKWIAPRFDKGLSSYKKWNGYIKDGFSGNERQIRKIWKTNKK